MPAHAKGEDQSACKCHKNAEESFVVVVRYDIAVAHGCNGDDCPIKCRDVPMYKVCQSLMTKEIEAYTSREQ